MAVSTTSWVILEGLYHVLQPEALQLTWSLWSLELVHATGKIHQIHLDHILYSALSFSGRSSVTWVLKWHINTIQFRLICYWFCSTATIVSCFSDVIAPLLEVRLSSSIRRIFGKGNTSILTGYRSTTIEGGWDAPQILADRTIGSCSALIYILRLSLIGMYYVLSEGIESNNSRSTKEGVTRRGLNDLVF